MKMSRSYTPATPYELQREDADDVHTVVGYYSARPELADEPGYRCIKREPETNPKKKTKGA